MYWDEFFETTLMLAAMLLAVLLFLLAIGGVVAAINYKQACVASEIYNKTHQTTYSCSDFFWAGNQINQSTQTINLNSK